MPQEQSEGFVLRTFPVGEQDKLIVFFSTEKGVFKGVAKGARKFGNRFGSCLEPLSHINLFYYEKENKELVTITNCDLIESFFDLQTRLELNVSFCYFAELIEEFCPARAKDDLLFRLLLSTLQAIKGGADLNLTSAYFEAWILKISGILPDFSRCKKCRTAIAGNRWLSPKKDGVYCDRCAPLKKESVPVHITAFLSWAKKKPPSDKENVPVNGYKTQAVRQILQSIIVFQMEREPKTLRTLKGLSSMPGLR